MIQTDKGDFKDFAHLRYAYLLEHKGNPPIQNYFRQGEWDESTLHISELGKCPRKQILRLIGAPRKTRQLSALANDELMFWQGNIIHALTVGACDWAGILVSYEESLPGLPDGWSGHYDLIWDEVGRRGHVCWDGKTVRPNAFNYWYDWPKKEEKAQMRGYLRFLKSCTCGEIEHIDRGGSNPPVISVVTAHNAWVDDKMAELNDWKNQITHYGDLPPVLQRDYSLTYLKVRNEPIHRYNSVYHGPQWECGWCDYLHGFKNNKTSEWTIFPETPCNPDMRPKDLVAKVSKGTLNYEMKEHQPHVKAWLEDQLLEWYDPEPAVD